MKKYIALIMLFALALAGCSSDKKSDDTTKDSKTQSSQVSGGKDSPSQDDDEDLLLSMFSEDYFPSEFYDGSAKITTDDDDQESAFDECEGNGTDRVEALATAEGEYTFGAPSELQLVVEIRSWETEDDAQDAYDRAISKLEDCYGQAIDDGDVTSTFTADDVFEPSFDNVDEYENADIALTVNSTGEKFVGYMYIVKVGRFAISAIVLGAEADATAVAGAAGGGASDLDAIAQDLLVKSEN